MTLDQLASLLRLLPGAAGSWDGFPRFAADPEWGPCECCTWHSLTDTQAIELNRVFDRLRELGAPPPGDVYPHCDGMAIAEWYGDSGRRVILHFFNKFGRDVMFFTPGKPSEFHKVTG